MVETTTSTGDGETATTDVETLMRQFTLATEQLRTIGQGVVLDFMRKIEDGLKTYGSHPHRNAINSILLETGLKDEVEIILTVRGHWALAPQWERGTISRAITDNWQRTNAAVRASYAEEIRPQGREALTTYGEPNPTLVLAWAWDYTFMATSDPAKGCACDDRTEARAKHGATSALSEILRPQAHAIELHLDVAPCGSKCRRGGQPEDDD